MEEKDFDRYFRTGLAELEAAGRLRRLREITGVGAKAVLEGREYWNFSGNDYLGVAGDAALRRAFYERMSDAGEPCWGLSAASSRLLTGNTPQYTLLETALSEWYGNGRAALVFNSGYHANVGILPALSRRGDIIFSDKLNHASIIDGLRLCEAEFRRYRHLDYEQLEDMLAQVSPGRRIFLVTESVFSMDGDVADLRGLAELKRKYGALLIVDEAHSAGVRGPRGTGLAMEQQVADEVDVLIGTFGKAFGSTGAYALMTPVLREYLVNRMRTLIFTTGLPPVVLAWSRFVLERMPELEDRRRALAQLAGELRAVIQRRGFATGGDSQVVPLLVGDDHAAGELAEKMRQGGILVFPIRPPTVPVGTARLRFSLNATLPEAAVRQVEALL